MPLFVYHRGKLLQGGLATDADGFASLTKAEQLLLIGDYKGVVLSTLAYILCALLKGMPLFTFVINMIGPNE